MMHLEKDFDEKVEVKNEMKDKNETNVTSKSKSRPKILNDYSNCDWTNFPLYERGDIILVDDNPNAIGTEYRFERPAIVVSKNNYKTGVVEIVYCSSKFKASHLATHIGIDLSNAKNGKGNKSETRAEQITTISVLRVKEKLGHLTQEDIEKVDDTLYASLGLKKATEITLDEIIKFLKPILAKQRGDSHGFLEQDVINTLTAIIKYEKAEKELSEAQAKIEKSISSLLDNEILSSKLDEIKEIALADYKKRYDEAAEYFVSL
ncbi:MAG: type II toxin-antitoxin system PemK/MazF family toxin [Spirochaetales bacterium]|nr:type II toxin-antitoxin system PemK/MazF family toxin [Spirochaetales bacterium]